ncbi:hypothetical protein [Acinetobacter calcoaceticus]|uniref:hypothetical protein n=1 Tax=Acinetobacter calcoaceticus TaxID=471 RepID=UPI000FDA5385|nr:hypothetical protein [Acinetobacter calcoaceticus]
MATVNAIDVIDGDKNQHEINNVTLAHGYAHWRDLREFGTVLADQTTDHTTLILNALSQLSEGEALYIPRNVKWSSTSNSSAVYTAMKDNCVVIDDSGYESRFGKSWQASQQTYYKTKDYGTAGKANGNGLNIRADYHPYYTLENDALRGTGGCRSSVLFRFNDPAITDSFQIGGDVTDAATAHIGIALNGKDPNSNEGISTKTLKIGGFQSVSPGGWAINMDLVQDVTLNVGKRQIRFAQGTPEDYAAWQAANHVIRISQPSGHTGTFTKLWFKGSVVQHREDILDSGDRIFTPKTSGNGSMVYTNLNELGGFKKRIITGSIGATVSTIYSNGYCSNFGAAGAQTVNLPVPTKGLTFEFGVDTTQNLRIIPNAGANFIGKAADKYMESNTLGSKLRVIALNATTWAFDRSGTWTDQV